MSILNTAGYSCSQIAAFWSIYFSATNRGFYRFQEAINTRRPWSIKKASEDILVSVSRKIPQERASSKYVHSKKKYLITKIWLQKKNSPSR